MWQMRNLLALAMVVASFAAIQAVSAADPPRMFQEATAEGGELKYVAGIPILFLEGDAGADGTAAGGVGV